MCGHQSGAPHWWPNRVVWGGRVRSTVGDAIFIVPWVGATGGGGVHAKLTSLHVKRIVKRHYEGPLEAIIWHPYGKLECWMRSPLSIEPLFSLL